MDIYEQEARQRRTPALQSFLDSFAESCGIPADFIAAGDHPYTCRCQKCLDWWASMGPDGEPDESGAFGPFSRGEIEDYCEKIGGAIWW